MGVWSLNLILLLRISWTLHLLSLDFESRFYGKKWFPCLYDSKKYSRDLLIRDKCKTLEIISGPIFNSDKKYLKENGEGIIDLI